MSNQIERLFFRSCFIHIPFTVSLFRDVYLAVEAVNLTIEQSKWSRRVVQTLPCMNWATIQPERRPWLCLDGAHSQTLEQDVQAITKNFEYRWVWRDTAWEYGSPGYRHGPLLIPLTEARYAHAQDNWLHQRVGLILLGPEDGDNLVAHLQTLHWLRGADGSTISFSLHAVRQLEELCEALPPHRLAALFGPIHRIIWYAGTERSGEWVCADAPAWEQASSGQDEPIALTEFDEISLDHASLAWFMRDCVRGFRQHIPAYAHPDDEPALWRHVDLFVKEATDQLALTTERDVRHYLELRLRYPQEFFVKDAALRGVLVKRHVQGKQRLIEAEARLAALATPTS
ncbi:DUF4123 domain-containing protein [Achromobacter sp. NFACC18-2]|uniref:DUF4123 domain-containing protein n=1 Tax=Achromobacter sp. NFACC18-2 TaxID=1564112 RepID=UPI0008CAD616|nr:DUF4123 domain-containing protein [Achromobacter sp. NFACC18-2]SEI38769.1 protein of unknown function [Achromobacter sp. NFACC18-2]